LRRRGNCGFPHWRSKSPPTPLRGDSLLNYLEGGQLRNTESLEKNEKKQEGQSSKGRTCYLLEGGIQKTESGKEKSPDNRTICVRTAPPTRTTIGELPEKKKTLNANRPGRIGETSGTRESAGKIKLGKKELTKTPLSQRARGKVESKQI